MDLEKAKLIVNNDKLANENLQLIKENQVLTSQWDNRPRPSANWVNEEGSCAVCSERLTPSSPLFKAIKN